MVVTLIERRKSSRYACLGTIPGTLVAASDRSRIHCVSTDVSRTGFAAWTTQELAIGSEVILVDIHREVTMLVVSAKQRAADGKWRVGCATRSAEVNIEALFRAAGCIGSPSDAKPARGEPATPKEAVQRGDRAPRYELSGINVVVDAKTLGTRTMFRLQIGNISRTGLLVMVEGGKDLPFLVNTLVEMVIDPLKAVLKTQVHGFAKVVRRMLNTRPDGTNQVEFGLLISEIFPEDMAAWSELITHVEKAAALTDPSK